MTFLADFTERPLAQTVPGLTPIALYVGAGQLALEVAVYRAGGALNAGMMQGAWRSRQMGRGAPLLTVALVGDRAWLAGPSGESLPVREDQDVAAMERLCAAALRQPDRNAALLFLTQALPSLDTAAPGLRNEGLFALHELTNDAPKRPEWTGHLARARAVLQSGAQGHDLLRSLGYAVDRLDNITFLLRGGDRRLALAVLLDQSEVPEAGSDRFGALSPVSYALHKADAENLDWVVLMQGDRLRLYSTRGGVGVGRRGPTETYLELQTSVLSDDHAAYLTLLFSADALQPGGSVANLLADSQRFASDLANDLRDRIYTHVMPVLAQGIAAARGLSAPTAADLALTYRMALTVLFRLLFTAYAEDRDLLPYRHSDAYRRRSLKQKAQELAAHAQSLTPPAAGDRHWREVAHIWTAIERGDDELKVPAYDGGLFTADPTISPAGAALAKLSLDNEVFEPVLAHLLLSDLGDGLLQPVDFRSLGVREFGTIYEGLLESELSVADQDLALDAKDSYVPVRGRAQPVVRQGQIYLHDRSGARKASGSYFTKTFAVDHLLDRSLGPALDEHLARVASADAPDAEAFFDFRVADIAMGSGHFLIAAIDRIEKAFTGHLAQPGARGAEKIRAELVRLRSAARAALGDMADDTTLEDSQLLRRLIARRCIYGVDLNPLSVELTRLAIWIHTFVPGLPLSMLDHHLVHGNALVGVGTVAEIREVFEAATTTLFPVDADNLLGQAQRPLRRLANLADATLTDVAQAREAMREAMNTVSDTKGLCDIIAGQRIIPSIRYQFGDWDRRRTAIQSDAARHSALAALEGLDPLHFPCAFPEVFLRQRSGFDVLVGNPPWQEATIEDHGFWARHFPGLRGLPQASLEREREHLRAERPDLQALLEAEVAEAAKTRRALTSGAYPGMGTGDPDLYKAFMWRFWNLAAEDGGRIGVVLPRSAFAAKGSAPFREHVFTQASAVDLTMLLNKRHWVFDEVHEQWLIGLLAIAKGRHHGTRLTLRGPASNPVEFQAVVDSPGVTFPGNEVISWTDSAALPLLSSPQSVDVFVRLRASPRLATSTQSGWRARPDAELHATNQKPIMILQEEAEPNSWPVYKGESFNLWEPDLGFGTYYAQAMPDVVLPWLFERRLRSGKSRRDSAHSEFSLAYRQDKSTLAPRSARIAFRDGTNRLNERTVICCLVPPSVFLANTAPYLLFPVGGAAEVSYVLGVLSSIPLDWYARRFVERHLNFFLLNTFPIPRPLDADPLRQRVVKLAGRLAAPDERFTAWAAAVGVEHGPLNPDIKQEMIDELDAVVARLYGLSEGQLSHVFETFHEGWDFAPRLSAVLHHFRRWAS